MNISKINPQIFTGSLRFTTKPDCIMETHDASTLKDFRPAGINDKGTYIGCAFEVDGKNYITTEENNIPFLYYSNMVVDALKSDNRNTLKGLFHVKEVQKYSEPDVVPVPHPGESEITGLPTGYPLDINA